MSLFTLYAVRRFEKGLGCKVIDETTKFFSSSLMSCNDGTDAAFPGGLSTVAGPKTDDPRTLLWSIAVPGSREKLIRYTQTTLSRQLPAPTNTPQTAAPSQTISTTRNTSPKCAPISSHRAFNLTPSSAVPRTTAPPSLLPPHVRWAQSHVFLAGSGKERTVKANVSCVLCLKKSSSPPSPCCEARARGGDGAYCRAPQGDTAQVGGTAVALVLGCLA